MFLVVFIFREVPLVVVCVIVDHVNQLHSDLAVTLELIDIVFSIPRLHVHS